MNISNYNLGIRNSMFALLLQYHLTHFLRYFRTRRTAKLITVGLFLLTFSFIGVGIYLFFREGFAFLGAEAYFKDALTLYVFELYLLLVVCLVMLGSLITILFSLFKSQENAWVMGSPNFRIVPVKILIRVIMQSLWPLLIIVLPALLSLRTVFGLTAVGLIVSLIAITLLLVLIILATFAVIVLIAALLGYLEKLFKLPLLRMQWLVIAILAIMAAIFWLVWRQAVNIDIIQLFRVSEFSESVLDPGVIGARFFLFPSHFAALAIFTLLKNNYLQVGVAILKLILSAVIAALIFVWSNRWFLTVWQKLQESSFFASAKQPAPRTKKTVHFRGSPMRAVFAKEAIMFVRNPRSLLWFLFLLLVWLAQTGLNLAMAGNIGKYELLRGVAPVMTQVLQFVTVCFFISAFVLRFAFPAFSTERRTAWILASAPLKPGRIFWIKLAFYLVVFALLGGLVAYVNVSALGLSIGLSALTLTLFFTAVIFITVLGVSLGALFPNFETDDPAMLSTSLPGLAFIVISLAYAALGAFMLFIILTRGLSLPTVIFELATVFAVAVLLYAAPRALERIDYIKSVG